MNKIFNKTYDVIIVGGGIAGISASLSSARYGLKTALIEKQNILGGLATSGLISIYFPLCDGKGNQVTFGIAEELLKASLEYSPFELPVPWNGMKLNAKSIPRYMCQFSPAALVLAADELLAAANVDVWLDTLVTGVKKDSANKIIAIDVHNVSGKGVMNADKFIDASGDASLIRLASGNLTLGSNRHGLWFLEAYDKLSSFDFYENLKLTSLQNDCSYNYSQYSGKAVTSFNRNGWQLLRKYYRKSYADLKTTKNRHFPIVLPTMPQFRTIAKITGHETIRYDNMNSFVETSVGICADWRYPNRVFETPLGALFPKDVSGVIVAGRIIATDNEAWEVFRVIPAAAMTGEIAGTIVAVSKTTDIDSQDIDFLRQELAQKGFLFHCSHGIK